MQLADIWCGNPIIYLKMYNIINNCFLYIAHTIILTKINNSEYKIGTYINITFTRLKKIN